MSWLNRIFLLPKAAAQLGMRPLWLYAKYQLKLRSGWLRLQTPARGRRAGDPSPLAQIFEPVAKEELLGLLGEGANELYKEADEILQGRVRLFGGEPRPLELVQPTPLAHWTRTHSRMPDGTDIKPMWEAGRFGWATVLARAYWLSGEERYAKGFWKYFEVFVASNPPNMGPQWSSAQEVALRVIHWALCSRLLSDAASSTPARLSALAESVAQHAERIPLTLDYARAQNNNHLLSEAAGLYTAGALLPDHPKAKAWRGLGASLFAEGLSQQIHDDGAYAQHSSNYHRLMLQLGTWMATLTRGRGEQLPAESLDQLRKATAWLTALLDEASGGVPNLGPNDGAYILPLSALPFWDFRPALQAASTAFGAPVLPQGPWDELALWLGWQPKETGVPQAASTSPLRLDGKDSWAYLRAAPFRERPGHADQLHVDLWWRGLNIAMDAGSYLYTAPAPWDNALASTRVHNTLLVAGREQMTDAGRFLWLDWAQAKVLATRSKDGRVVFVSAEHNGYRRLGLIHRRDVTAEANRWVVTDHVVPVNGNRKNASVRLHWLLPDWDWRLEDGELRLESPAGYIELNIDASVGDQANFALARAGELVHGSMQAVPILGWFSPTYGEKQPALSFVIDVSGQPPLTITTTWTLPA